MPEYVPSRDMSLLIQSLEPSPVPAVLVDLELPDQPIVYVNSAFERLTGYCAGDVTGRNCRFLQGQDRDQAARHELRRCLASGESGTVILRNYRKDGTPFLNEISVSPISNADGTVTHFLGFVQDVTGRVRLQAIADRHPDPLMSFGPNWTMTYVNAAAATSAGGAPDSLVGQFLIDAYPAVIGTPSFEAAQRVKATGTSQQVITYSDQLSSTLTTTAYPTDGEVTVILHDVTLERDAIVELRTTQERFSKVFQVSPIPIFISRLSDGMFVDANPAFLSVSQYEFEDLIGVSASDLYADPADRDVLLGLLRQGHTIEDHPVQYRVKSGEIREATIVAVPIEISGEPCLVTMLRNVTEVPGAAAALLSTPDQATLMVGELRRALDASLDMITVLDHQRRFVSVSAACYRILGYRPDELIGHSYLDFVHPDDRGRSAEGSHALRTQKYLKTFQNRFVHKDGTAVWLDWTATRQADRLTFAVARDITERRAAIEDQAFLAAIVQGSPDAIIGLTVNGTIRAWNSGAERMYGYAAAEMIGRQITAIVPPDLVEEERRLLECAAQGQYTPVFETVRVSRAGIRIPVQLSIAPIFDSQGAVIGASKIAQDISLRRASEQQIRALNATLQRKLDHLTGLRAIDQTIASSLDLKMTLGVVLDQVMGQVDVEAAAAMIFDPSALTLSQVAARGLPSSGPVWPTLRLGQGGAGRVALTRQPEIVNNLNDERAARVERDGLDLGGFSAYAAVPLLAKGKVLGVLEVFRREPFDAQSDWLETLTTLAGQAAIAVDNAQLFLNLERRNLELALAYQETIEGWARALDLRDRETEGHSRRVTELTVKLCRALGMADTDLVNVERGALLHDIGKMGIADAILLKPGPLTEDEWQEMRKHPGYAVDLLSPIRYLRPSLDIPQYHHEKWDGSGYPKGLRETEIPLTARAFAVVDVYDALTNDRPYRSAWSREEALTYLQAQAGRHFDPHVVAVFIDLLQRE